MRCLRGGEVLTDRQPQNNGQRTRARSPTRRPGAGARGRRLMCAGRSNPNTFGRGARDWSAQRRFGGPQLVQREGSKRSAAARGSWNVMSGLSWNHTSANAATGASGPPASAKRRRHSAAGIRHCVVTSMPTAVRRGTGAANTMAAAWGSHRMFHSGCGRSKYQPPISTSSFKRRGISGSAANSRAILVSGPIASSVISPGRARMARRRKSRAVWGANSSIARCGHCPDSSADACGARGCRCSVSRGAAVPA